MTTAARQRAQGPAVTGLAWALCVLSAAMAAAAVALATVNGESPL